MDEKIKRNLKKSINKLFRKFSVQLEYSKPIEETDDDFGLNPNHKHDDFTFIQEPLFPNTSSTTNQIMPSNGGSIEQYSYVWLSRLQVPMKTHVRYHGMQFTVIDKADYKDLAGIYEYYLKGRSDRND